MMILRSLFLLDASAVMLMLIVAYLSKRLGEALKIASYYKIMYITAILVFIAFGTDAFCDTIQYQMQGSFTMAIRSIAGVFALLACLPYWKWLFFEYLYRRR
jgi:uncharacterized membrane-anchored protein